MLILLLKVYLHIGHVLLHLLERFQHFFNLILFSWLFEETNQLFFHCRWWDAESLRLLSGKPEAEARSYAFYSIALFLLHNFAFSFLSPEWINVVCIYMVVYLLGYIIVIIFMVEMRFHYYFSLRKFSVWAIQSLKKW